ncbi:HD domain-containing protein [Peptacetobacter hominis]|uniref:HD domain-containing protein n=1 Tax=Peptacetobacter hominis TaxID=2743610 RepID=A0A544QT54_9FIRM|nr:HD domain-containing protein [Peptacetobacter hominis]TQQ83218.1 HD domain-containing protein [Peptacetobacter hominis]
MKKSEMNLISSVLKYEDGHPRRTQHVLKVYALSILLGEKEKISDYERDILGAAAILHDIAIKYCKENLNGDACQENQRKHAPELVKDFMLDAGYEPKCIDEVIELVLKHHEYDNIDKKLLQILIEADLIINAYESGAIDKNIIDIFKTEEGKNIVRLVAKNL